MNALPHTHPTLYGHFANGRHSIRTIRRSDRLCAGLSCDLVIEQTLMKSVKSRGGLSHGRGMHETVRQIWPEKLQPSEHAGYFHVLRVHLQAVEWKTLSCHTLLPANWGWKQDGDHFVPVTTDLPVTPDEILNVVRCGCKTACSSALCSCRKNGLKCMSAC